MIHAVFHLIGFEFTDDLGVGDLFVAVNVDIPVTYDLEGISAFNTLCFTVWYF